ncbi:MAG: MotA/TolQ/ExbB proton channel family protein [Proteobacteria bacterium]|nr:MotA/TolQ/ExbB proton channel family protein [Cystobacterineae bacterium]MCL2314367.1 MotA/TolQ/ExbB proton channel family protein [Pseudomonadota bacterium]
MNSLLQWLHLDSLSPAGGLTLAVILLASLLSLTVAVERLVVLWSLGPKTRTLFENIARQLLQNDIPAAKALAERSPLPVAEVFRVGFQTAQRANPSTAIERERLAQTLKLKGHLWLLGTIGAVTPFIGLFGTVAGIMTAFKELGLDVQAGGAGGPASVMTGISEALIATAAGILVAVVAVVLFNYFQSRLSRLSMEFKLIFAEFTELLLATMPAATTPPPAPPSPSAPPAPSQGA